MGQGRKTPGIPYVLDRALELHVRGRMSAGGVLEFHVADTQIDLVELPAAELALVALLIKRAQQGDDWGDAFLTSDDLARIAHLTCGALPHNPDRIPQIVHQFRKRIAGRDARLYKRAGAATGEAFSRELLQHHRRLGYRLGLPPENLHVRLIGPPAPSALPGATPEDFRI